MKLFYTPESVNDLKRLKEFIEIKNPIAAKKAALNLREGIDNLVAFPEIGLPVSKAPEPEMIRDLFVGNYTVRYLIQRATIHILRIWHNKENENDSS